MAKLRIPKALKWVLLTVIISVGSWFLLFRERNHTNLVRKVTIQNRLVLRTITANGSIESKSEASLSFQTVGKIAKINVKKGDSVQKGQLLAYQDTSAQDQTVQYYSEALEIEKRQRDLFVHDMWKNVKSLGGETEYGIKLREYNENVDQAEAQYKSQLATQKNVYLYAPFTGTVTDVSKDTGEIATAGETVITIADLNNLVFTINVDQEDFGLLREGMDANIKLDSYENIEFKGKVLSPPLFANTDTDKFDVDIKTDPQEGKAFVLGMLGDGHIVLQTSGSDVLSLTVDEISYDEADKPYVWIIENRKIKKKYIEIVLDGDLYVQVGTAIPETIVVSAKDGQKMVEGYTAKVIN